jgi:hypothetical protein
MQNAYICTTIIIEVFTSVIWNVCPDDNCHVAVALLQFI